MSPRPAAPSLPLIWDPSRIAVEERGLDFAAVARIHYMVLRRRPEREARAAVAEVWLGQVEDVATAKPARGLTFLTAGWPRLMNAKLGFEAVGELHVLRRPPGAAT